MKTVGICASGPSLTMTDCRYLKERSDKLIVINDTFRMISGDILYAADSAWWHRNIADVKCGFMGERFSCETPGKTNWSAHCAEEWGINLLDCDVGGSGLSRDPKKVVGGQNSGYQAIGLARHVLGDEGGRIVLLGYDMTWTGGKSHWFGNHPKGLNNLPPDRFIANFRTIKPEDYNLEIINATRSTALDAFPCVALEDIF